MSDSYGDNSYVCSLSSIYPLMKLTLPQGSSRRDNDNDNSYGSSNRDDDNDNSYVRSSHLITFPINPHSHVTGL